MSDSQHYPLGHSVNGSLHSVVVSLPTMADVIGYEEKDPRILAAMGSGYPRFFEHAFLSELKRRWHESGLLPSGCPVLTARAETIEAVVAYVGETPLARGAHRGLGWLVYPDQNEPACCRARAFLQHTGTGPTSRQIEDILVAEGWREQVTEETTRPGSEADVVAALAPAFRVPESHLILAQGGMNAIYATFATINRLLRPEGRYRWVQLGWLYVDTIKMLKTMCLAGGEPIVWSDVFNLKGLAAKLRPIRHEIAGIVTEVPTNPLIQTPDVVALRALADELGCPLVLDPSVASVANVDVSRWADVVVASLTKYTARSGDVMLGAAAVHPDRRWSEALMNGIRSVRVPPYQRDLERLNAELVGWEAFATHTSQVCAEVAIFLENHPKIERVWWAGQALARDGYRRIANDKQPRWGGVLSFSINGSMEAFYDAMEVAKGPSFGTRFSLMAPFIYLAHYELVKTAAGRAQLAACGLDPSLIRLSIGDESAADLIARLDAALAHA